MTLRTTRPITSKRQALELLKRGWNDGTMRYVRTIAYGQRIRVIGIENYTRAREELEFTNHYEISREIFEWLKINHLIIGVPYWGGRSTWEFKTTDAFDELAWSYELCPRLPDEEDLPPPWEHPR